MFDVEFELSDELTKLMREGKIRNQEVEDFLRPTEDELTRDLVDAFRNDYNSWNRKPR